MPKVFYVTMSQQRSRRRPTYKRNRDLELKQYPKWAVDSLDLLEKAMDDIDHYSIVSDAWPESKWVNMVNPIIDSLCQFRYYMIARLTRALSRQTEFKETLPLWVDYRLNL